MTAIQMGALITIVIALAILYWVGYRGGLIDGRAERVESGAIRTAKGAAAHAKCVQALHDDIARLNRLRRQERVHHLNELQEAEGRLTRLQAEVRRKSSPFTSDDYRLLVDVAQMLNLASRTWAAMGNIEPAIRQNAAELERQVGGVALRIRAAVASSSADDCRAMTSEQPVRLGGAA